MTKKPCTFNIIDIFRKYSPQFEKSVENYNKNQRNTKLMLKTLLCVPDQHTNPL